MADLRVTSTGKTFYQIDSAVAAVLLEALPTVFERVEKPTFNVAPSNPKTPYFVARLNPLWGTPEVVWTHVSQHTAYPGRPGIIATVEGAKAAFAATGHPVPEEVLDQFAALLEAVRSDDPDTFNEKQLSAANKQYAREQAERAAQRKLSGE